MRMFAYPMILFASIAVAPSVAAEDLDGPLDRETIKMMDEWAKCYATKRYKTGLISAYSFEPDYSQVVAASRSHQCLRPNGRTMKGSFVQVIGAVYIAMLRASPRGNPLVAIDGPAYDGDRRDATDLELQKTVNSYFVAAECTVKRAPAESYKLAISQVNSEEQRNAFETLRPDWEACSPPVQSIQTFTLQALLARTIARMNGLEPAREAANA